MRLAAHLGGMTLAEMHSRMSANEFVEWLAKERIDPIPDPHLMLAQLMSMIANAWFKGRYSPADFMPARSKAREPQSAAEGIARLKAYAAAYEASQR